MAEIKGIKLREIICKNDNCRKLLGYEKLSRGVMLFICPRCKTTSTFRINYGQGREFIDKIIYDVENQNPEGGEK